MALHSRAESEGVMTLAYCHHCRRPIQHTPGKFKVVEVEYQGGTLKPFVGRIIDPNSNPGRWGKLCWHSVVGDSFDEVTAKAEEWANRNGMDLHFHYSPDAVIAQQAIAAMKHQKAGVS